MTEIIPFKKTPIGTMDLYDASYDEIQKIIKYLETLFVNYGGKGLETPMFEIRENLLSKYGEEAENLLIFNLSDTGSDTQEKYTLRYDLTIPKIRHIISNNIIKERIYSIGKVFRRDNPSLGRYREFYQADFDIIGESNESMINEYLMFKMIKQFMNDLNIIFNSDILASFNYKIYVNFTQNLHHILINLLNVEPNMFKSICSTIDKLDKYSFDDLINEFSKKSLTIEQITQLKTYLVANNLSEPIDQKTQLLWNKLKLLIQNDDQLNNKIIFCPSLARGLDYYNGIIYEVKFIGDVNNSQLTFSSSIISGGRYDNLIPNTQLLGLSFGISRIISIFNKIKQTIEQTKINNNVNSESTFVWKNLYYLVSIKGVTLNDKIKYWNLLEKHLNQQIIISDEETDKKLVKVITYCITHGIRYLYVLAPDELKNEQIIFKDLKNQTQTMVDIKTI